MQSEIKQRIDWLLDHNLPPLPVAPAQDSRAFPKIVKGNSCPLDKNLNPIPLYTGKNPSFLGDKIELVNHGNYQEKLPSQYLLKKWFANPENGIGTLGGIPYKGGVIVWIDLDRKCFSGDQEFELAVEYIDARLGVNLVNCLQEKTHSGGRRWGIAVKSAPDFTNFCLEPGGFHAGELLGKGRFTVLAPSLGPSGNFYETLHCPQELGVIERIDFLFPVSATATAEKPKREKKERQPVSSGSLAIALESCLSRQAQAVLRGDDPKGDESYSLSNFVKEAYGWENWLNDQRIPFTGSPESLVLEAAASLGHDEDKAARVIKSCKDLSQYHPSCWFSGGDESCWKVIKRLNKQVPTPSQVEVKTSTPLQPVNSYVEDANPDEPSQDSQEAIILPPSYSYQERAVMAIYGKGKYIAHGGELFKYNGKFYEKLEAELEALKIRDWARNECDWNEKEKRYVYKYLTPTCLDNIWKWALIVYAVSSKLINPPGLNLSNGILTLYQKGKEIKHELLPHTPDKYFLYCSDVEFKPDADPKFCNQLLEALDPPERKIFIQTLAAGLDLAWVRKHQGRIKAIIAKGSGSNGKDSIKNAIVRIFTQEQVCNVPFSSFKAYDNGQKYDLTKLRDKKVNWSSENNQTTVLDRSESLNCAITGNGIDYRDMNKLPKEFEPVCINIFNVNLVPKATGGLESFLSRFAVIEFTKTFANDPDPSQGQIQADSRFAYDPEFMREQVCPALLNLLLEEFPQVVEKGIDYSPLKKSLNELQEDSNHLWGFVRDYNIVADPNGRVYIADLWIALKQWYQDTGTLEVCQLSNGDTKEIWHDQPNKYDKNVVASNQVAKRFQELFPKAKKEREKRDPDHKGANYLAGVKFLESHKETASLLHYPDTASDTASPTASLPFTLLHQEKSEANSEPVKQNSEATTLVYQQSEAVKQSDPPALESGWAVKNGHKLTEEMWVIVPKLGACQLKEPLANGWRVWARDAGGVMASVEPESITHVWEV